MKYCVTRIFTVEPRILPEKVGSTACTWDSSLLRVFVNDYCSAA